MNNLVLEKLCEWRESHHIPNGLYRGNPYAHIIELPSYGKGERRNAVAEALTNYDVLTDGVKYFPNVLPVKELHPYANHLNSSQILCYNFFGKLLAINNASQRIIRITPDMMKWLELHLPTVPRLSDSACCAFESVVNPTEGTSFDFIVYDDKTEIRFEIKYTEDGFGKTKKDSTSKSGISHLQKFKDIYHKQLREKSKLIRHPVNEDDFFSNYQLFRNVISGNRTGAQREIYNVFIFPEWNKKCTREFEHFINNYIVDKSRIISLKWDKIVPQNMTGLLKKYHF